VRVISLWHSRTSPRYLFLWGKVSGPKYANLQIKRNSLGVFSFSHLFFSKQRIKVWAIKHFLDIWLDISRHHVSEQMTKLFYLNISRIESLIYKFWCKLQTQLFYCVSLTSLLSIHTRFIYEKLAYTSILSANSNPRWNDCIYCDRTRHASSI